MPDPLAGYVYIMINPAMPGLVKVGRTGRDPLDRLEELSSATGVPTPFELVFDILVADAEATEARLHKLLTAAGYRVADNREFFRAPIHEVVRLMLQLRESDTHVSLATTPEATGIGREAAPELDPLLRAAALTVVEAGAGSTSVLQRGLRIGYGHAVSLLDQLQAVGVLGPPNGPNPRTVLMERHDIDAVLPPT